MREQPLTAKGQQRSRFERRTTRPAAALSVGRPASICLDESEVNIISNGKTLAMPLATYQHRDPIHRNRLLLLKGDVDPPRAVGRGLHVAPVVAVSVNCGHRHTRLEVNYTSKHEEQRDAQTAPPSPQPEAHPPGATVTTTHAQLKELKKMSDSTRTTSSSTPYRAISSDELREVLTRWTSDSTELDVIEQRPRRVNRILAPPTVRGDERLLRFAVEHSVKSGRRVVVVLGTLRLALIDGDVVVVNDLPEALVR